MKVAPPKTPQEIRDLILSDVTLAEDRHLLALLLAKGASLRPRRGRARKSRTTLELAESVLEEVGGCRLLVEKTHAGVVDLPSFGIGIIMGARLVAGMELVYRWCDGFKDGGDGQIRADAEALQKVLFRRQRKASEAELIAAILGTSEPDVATAEALVAAFESPQELVASLTFDDFESFRKESVFHLRLSGSQVELELPPACRLVATLELARRYRAGKGPKLPALKVGTFGLKSPVLVELLDPGGSVDPKLRRATLEVLRSHPEMAADFMALDRLALDAGTRDFLRAIELSLMFEMLRKHTAWTHPSEVLGEAVPVENLLRIARTRIDRSSRPPTRIVKIQERLAAVRQVPERLIKDFVQALVMSDVSLSAAEKAIEEARCRYLERVAPDRAGAA